MRRSKAGILTIEPGEGLDDVPKALGQRLLRKLDLPRVEGPDTADLEAGADLRRQLALRAAQHNVDELRRRRHRGDVLERGPHCGGWFVAAGGTCEVCEGVWSQVCCETYRSDAKGGG